MFWKVEVVDGAVGGDSGVNAEVVEPVRGGGETEAKRSLMF